LRNGRFRPRGQIDKKIGPLQVMQKKLTSFEENPNQIDQSLDTKKECGYNKYLALKSEQDFACKSGRSLKIPVNIL
jgi:hypothetical protein